MNSDDFYEQLDQMVEDTEALEQQLRRLHLTLPQAEAMLREWQQRITTLSVAHELTLANKALFCRRLDSLSDKLPLEDMLSLYVAVLRDKGLLFHRWRISKQDIGCFLSLWERMKQAKAALYLHAEYSARFERLKLLRHPFDKACSNIAAEADVAFVLKEFSRLAPSNEAASILRENISLLCGQITANRDLLPVAPILLYQIAHKCTKALQASVDSHFSWHKLWNEKCYQIEADNGKNFRQYQLLINLFLALCRYFKENSAVDLDFNHYLFARLSNLSDWYYRHKSTADDTAYLEIPFPLQIAQLGIECFEDIPDYGLDEEASFALYEKDVDVYENLATSAQQFLQLHPSYLEDYIQLHPVISHKKRRFVEQLLTQSQLPILFPSIQRPALCEVLNIILDTLVNKEAEAHLIHSGQILIDRLISESSSQAR